MTTTAEKAITACRLRELLSYDENTGIFTRLVRTSNRINVGDVAGYLRPDGYVRILVDGQRWLAHRLAWIYVYGTPPIGEVDHINQKRADNRICNLRDESTITNQHNQRRAHRQSKTGLLGASPYRNGSFVAQISVAGTSHFLGLHSTPEAAHEAYVQAKRRLHKGCTL